jgi:hypothetical protein
VFLIKGAILTLTLQLFFTLKKNITKGLYLLILRLSLSKEDALKVTIANIVSKY